MYTVELTDTIGTLKAKIHSWDGPAVDTQILEIGGYLFNDDNARLVEFMNDGDEIFLTADVPEKEKGVSKFLGQKDIYAITKRKRYKMSKGNLSNESGVFALVRTLDGEHIGEREYQAEIYDVDVTDGGPVQVKMEEDKVVVYANGEKQIPQRIENHNEKEIQREFAFTKVLDYFRNYNNWIGNIVKTVQ